VPTSRELSRSRDGASIARRFFRVSVEANREKGSFIG
jgi:hypothetical protein